MLLLSTVLFSLGAGSAAPPAQSEALPQSRFVEDFTKNALYLGTGVAFSSAAILSRFGWEISRIIPGSSTLGNESLLLSHLCSKAAWHIFAQLFQTPPHFSSQQSWNHNQALLSEIAFSSPEEKNLIGFLQNRWLSKSTGLISTMVDWVYPCFGVFIQVHPKTTHSYARNPSEGLPQTYQQIVDEWKKELPHPLDYPLLLTRPFDVKDYLPSLLAVPSGEKIQATVERLGSHQILDLTEALQNESWDTYKEQLTQECKQRQINLNEIICIQRVQHREIGGIRLLPLTSSKERLAKEQQFLLDSISHFGLTASRVELDRWPVSYNPTGRPPLNFLSKEEFLSFLTSFTWKSDHSEKSLMVKGALDLLKGLLAQDKWDAVLKNPTKASLAELSFFKIKEQFELLAKNEKSTFSELSSHFELIHADLSSLLEISAPFTSDDFAPIYRNLLTSIPAALKPLTSCGVHASGMTSLTGILKAVERSAGQKPRVLYGENTYFETSMILEQITKPSPIEEATEEDWKEVDLIIAQFNPVLKRIDLEPTVYKVEKIAEALHSALNTGRIKPVTLALDCTLDFINSSRVKNLLEEFQNEIESGFLNIVGYRSGLKFDLFGMDNYAGAPFYMIHNQDTKWDHFDALLTDRVLQADRLSLNWFCLAYQYGAPQLDLYRKQVFDNTRTLLNKIPQRLFKNGAYRVIPVEQDGEISFIDIKVFGPLHKLRSAACVSGCLYLHAMAGGHPIFNRPSLGFYHPNFTMIFTEKCSTIRLTLGLDPSQINLLASCFEMIDRLND